MAETALRSHYGDAAAANAALDGGGRLKRGDRVAILDAAAAIRSGAMQSNDLAARTFLNDRGPGGFDDVLAQHVAQHAPPGADLGDAGVRSAFTTALRQTEEHRQKRLGRADLQLIAQGAISGYYAKQQARFAEAHPGLAAMPGQPFADDRLFDNLLRQLHTGLPDPNPNGSPLRQEPESFRGDAAAALALIQGTGPLLARMSFDPAAARGLQDEVAQRWLDLNALEAQIAHTPGPLNQAATDLQTALVRELRHQKTLLETKEQFLQEFRQSDPLSNKNVAYDKLVWAQAQHVVLHKEIARLEAASVAQPTQKPQNDKLISGDPLAAQNSPQQLGLRGLADQLVKTARREYDTATPDRSDVPQGGKTKWYQKLSPWHQPHPFEATAREAKTELRAKLRGLGLSGSRSDKLAGGVKAARVTALDTMQDWQPIVRGMVVSRGGVTRKYVSEIVPASQLRGAVGASYKAGAFLDQPDAVGGVTAANKTDPHHARNLQVSRLHREDPTTQTRTLMSQIVRHGVIDAWMIPDPAARAQANLEAAKEVLTTAVEHTTHPEFKNALLRKAANPQPGDRPSRLTHVNFNLTTPSTLREPVGGADYKEKAFTYSQFEAFAAHNGSQKLTVQDAHHQNVPVDVEIDSITFSFGVNDLSQAPGLALADGWSNVYEHDKANLQKLLGDLDRGSRPGGVIGEAMDKLDAALRAIPAPANADELRGLKVRLQEQTDIVRTMFNDDAFRKGGSDPYKMVRHTMRLVDISAETLRVLGDADRAVTSSEGCKSNKDRGGMADVENKAQAIIEDMGGKVLPGQPFGAEDQVIYNTVLTSSGQDKVQQYMTGLPGSKNAHEAASRIIDPNAVEYARGFATHTSA